MRAVEFLNQDAVFFKRVKQCVRIGNAHGNEIRFAWEGFQTTYGLVAWFEYLDDVLPIHKAGKV